MINADIYVSIHFFSSVNEGRKLPTDSHMFGSIFVINESKHDCRLFLDRIGAISPGESKTRVPVKFLYPELVMPKLKVGSKFYLWDMRNIAEGEVEEIIT